MRSLPTKEAARPARRPSLCSPFGLVNPAPRTIGAGFCFVSEKALY